LRTPYKLELFDRNIDFKDVVMIGEQVISFDYLTLEKTRITTPMINAARGDYAHITDWDGRVIYQGIIDDYATSEGMCTLHIKPLLTLFNIKAFRVSAATVEGEIAGIIEAEYITNPDDLQNIPMTVTTTSATLGSLTVDSGIVDLYSVITAALSAYGIVVSAELKPQDKIIAVEIGVQDGSVTLEADTPNVINKNIVIGDSFGALNKLTLINEADETQRVTYHLHTDGTVSTVNDDRIWPVFASVEYINAKDFAEKAEERAIKALTPQKYDNLIELTYSRDDKLANAESLKIGDIADIWSGGNVYKGILTGYEIAAGTIKLVFGIVRVDLVKKLILQKRASDAARIGGGNTMSGYVPEDFWRLSDIPYESGTWTPTLYGSTTAGTPTYSERSGSYVRIGKVVHLVGRVLLASKGGMSGDLIIGGFPFPSNHQSAGVLGLTFNTAAVYDSVFVLNMGAGATSATVYRFSQVTLKTTEFGDNLAIASFEITYTTG
jgi:hypothetical protein